MTAAATARVHCPDHEQTNPCTGCAADHLLGEHAHGTRKTTCRKCRAPHPLDTTGRTDGPALAANDADPTHYDRKASR